MRVGVLGDVHGNGPALAAVLKDAQAEQVELLFITGDLVGYYYRPDEVMRLLSLWPYQAVQGNHEAMLAAAMVDPRARAAYRTQFGRGLDMALEQLAPGTLAHLTALPARRDLTLAGRRIILCHGASWDRDAYLYPDAPEALLQRCAEEQADAVCMGHTHHPMVCTVDGTLLLNPGAVGQPRDGDPRAAWAVLDLRALTAEIRRVPYPAAEVAAEARHIDPDLPYLAEVLLRDRRARQDRRQ